jgi:hypothetical protein
MSARGDHPREVSRTRGHGRTRRGPLERADREFYLERRGRLLAQDLVEYLDDLPWPSLGRRGWRLRARRTASESWYSRVWMHRPRWATFARIAHWRRKFRAGGFERLDTEVPRDVYRPRAAVWDVPGGVHSLDVIGSVRLSYSDESTKAPRKRGRSCDD